MRGVHTSPPALPGCGSYCSSSRAARYSHTQHRVCRRNVQATRLSAAAAGDGLQPAGSSSSNGTGHALNQPPTSSQEQQNQQQPPTSWRQTSATINGSSSSGKRAVVVGGGWAGFGAALALAKAGAHVTLLDAAANPGGLSSAFTTAGGQVVEPGIKGFWYQYANIEALVSELGIPSPFTRFTRSSFWSPDGLQVESPIFQNLPRLPTPLGSFVHTAPLFRQLSLADRATAAPLVKPLLEHDLDDALYNEYDSQSAYELFRAAGVSKKLYDKFLAPMLLVTLFAPPTELSAAAALGALYYFALAHQPDFDVRWCKGPIGELIFSPLVSRLQSLGVTILGSRRAQQILPAQHKIQNPALSTDFINCSSSSSSRGQLPGVVVAKGPDGLLEQHDADVIVLAAGVPALQQLLRSSPVLAAADDLRGVMGVSCSDVLAVRLWLQQKLTLRSASNVVAGFDEGVGGTFFQLDSLQDMYKGQAGSVLEFDMYHAQPLLPLSDEAIMQRMLQTYLAPALPGGAAQAAMLRVKDSSVLRFRNAVTRFSPGSNAQLPGICTSLPNLFVAGDCVKQGPGTHGCKGLSQEKAYVSGLQAGNSAAARLGLAPVSRVIPVEPDEPHVTAAKQLLRVQRQLANLGGSWTSAGRPSNSSSSSSSTRRRQQQVAVVNGAASSSSNSSSSSWLRDASSSERRARESHELRDLMISEVGQQVAEQQRQEQRVQ